jgi:acetyl esterase
MPELHPKLKEILAAPENPGATPVERQHPDEARAEWKADMKAVDAPAPDMKDVRALELPGATGPLAARLYMPRELPPGPAPVLIYYHGGGFIRGDLDTHDSICRVLANETPSLVVSAEYRLAPEHRFPAAIEDAYAVARHVALNATAYGADPRRIAVGGDSAGGNIAASVCLVARDRSGPEICFQLLIYPVTDLTSQTVSKQKFSKGYLLNSMPFYISSYLGKDGGGDHPLASPLLAPDLSKLPPAFVLTAGFDPLRDEGDAYAVRLARSGIVVEHRCYQDMIHGFVSLRGLLVEADAALQDCARRLARAFTGPLI